MEVIHASMRLCVTSDTLFCFAFEHNELVCLYSIMMYVCVCLCVYQRGKGNGDVCERESMLVSMSHVMVVLSFWELC